MKRVIESFGGLIGRTGERSSFHEAPKPAGAGADAAPTTATLSYWRRSWPLIAVLVYTVARILLIGTVSPFPGGISHDSGYILIVARNVLEGRGLVNDAHWLVFLAPPSLPMAFHNANPLYPLSIAVVSAATGLSVESSGFFISAAASSLAAGALLLLLGRFGIDGWQALVLAALAIFFPPVYSSSFELLPDSLWLALSLWFLVFLLRASRSWHYVAAGLCLGLAWLTRSTTVLLLPAVATYALLHLGWRRGIRAALIMGASAALAVSPWLLHTYRTWGRPLRSDSGYYLLQQYFAQAHGGELERFWHSITLPPSLADVLRTDAVDLARFWIGGIPHVVRTLAEAWGLGRASVAALLGVLAIALLASLRRLHREPMAIALGVYAATLIGAFAVRSYDGGFEIRYALLASTAFVVIVGWLALAAPRFAPTPYWRSAMSVVLAGAAVIWILAFVAMGGSIRRVRYGESRSIATYAELARDVARDPRSRPAVVVGYVPYLFTWASGVPSLSIPDSDDEYLDRYMRRYGATLILLTPEELAFWRPSWRSPGELPPSVRLVGRPHGAYLFEHQELSGRSSAP